MQIGRGSVIGRLALFGLAALAMVWIAVGTATVASATEATGVVSWKTNEVHIRVYISDGQTVSERGFDGGHWYTGGFKQPGQFAAATEWTVNGEPYIRVYVTNGPSITEWCWDAKGPWYRGAFTP